jgi:hypothetical protein
MVNSEMDESVASKPIDVPTQATVAFITSHLPSGAAVLEAAAFVEEVFREEAQLGERGAVVLVGRRIVGSRREGDTT